MCVCVCVWACVYVCGKLHVSKGATQESLLCLCLEFAAAASPVKGRAMPGGGGLSGTRNPEPGGQQCVNIEPYVYVACRWI